MRLIIFILTFMFSINVFAIHIELSFGKESEVCTKLFSKRLLKNTPSFEVAISGLADLHGTPAWRFRRLTNGDNPSSKSMEHAEFDIDNDGEDEHVYSDFSYMSGRPYRIYAVFDEDIIHSNDDLELNNFFKQAGIKSASKSFEFGLWHEELYPFKFKGEYYIGIEDIMFGKEWYLNRKFVVAQYSNEMIEGAYTSKLKKICVFEYVKANKSLQQDK